MQMVWSIEKSEQKKRIAIYKPQSNKSLFVRRAGISTKPARIYTAEEIENYKNNKDN
jgi:hypothetical protein